MRIYLPHEQPKTPVRGYQQRRSPRSHVFTKLTIVLFFFSVLIIAGAVAVLAAVPWKVAIGGALTAAGISTLKVAL